MDLRDEAIEAALDELGSAEVRQVAAAVDVVIGLAVQRVEEIYRVARESRNGGGDLIRRSDVLDALGSMRDA